MTAREMGPNDGFARIHLRQNSLLLCVALFGFGFAFVPTTFLGPTPSSERPALSRRFFQVLLIDRTLLPVGYRYSVIWGKFVSGVRYSSVL